MRRDVPGDEPLDLDEVEEVTRLARGPRLRDVRRPPREMFTPTFAAARLVGWSANILKQAAD
ncbi:hypothetical protein GR925_37560 [Streptomyces sp. HUCO-GS316]|nr:hypothetical protein [Streptomyces sp. HUCO-GS316]